MDAKKSRMEVSVSAIRIQGGCLDGIPFPAEQLRWLTKTTHIYAMSNKSRTLPNDIARCNGISYNEDDGQHWREGCETCMRRTAPRPKRVLFIDPPPIITFECEYLIEP
jgi:uncharacterized protein (DUF1786 family)